MSASVISPEQALLLQKENAALRGEIGQLTARCAELQAKLALLLKKYFGGGQGETLDQAQLLLAIDGLKKEIAAVTPPTETITYERPAGPAPKRTLPAESFAHLPVKETIELLPEAVKNDPTLYEKIGEERTFEVDLVPPKLFKREIVRPKFKHLLDRSRAPLLAPAPVRIAPGGFASAGLIAWALTAKYCDHLPLYRQEQMLARWGAPISRQNLCDWAGLATTFLEPLVKRMKTDLLKSGYVQVDETPIAYNDPELKDGKTAQGYLWALSRPGGDVVFEWRLSRKHEEAETLLGDYQGILQSDGYEAYPAYVRAYPGATWVGCWAHARRKFFEAVGERPKTATRVLLLIAQLYQLEAHWDEQDVGEKRAALRQEHFARPLARLKWLVLALQTRVLPQSGLGKACAYLLNHWAPLTGHLQYSQTKLDTNAVENAIRPSAIGKKNWLFVGHPAAGDRAAVLYSLIGSCRRYGHNPHEYLKDVLTRLPAMTTKDDLRPLLPSQWKALAPTPATPTTSQ
jgi:transposase